jgi:hypothetical protein
MLASTNQRFDTRRASSALVAHWLVAHRLLGGVKRLFGFANRHRHQPPGGRLAEVVAGNEPGQRFQEVIEGLRAPVVVLAQNGRLVEGGSSKVATRATLIAGRARPA